MSSEDGMTGDGVKAAPVRRVALGRGLGALLGETRREESLIRVSAGAPEGAALPREGGVSLLSVSDIEPDPNQPRRHFDEDALEELARSIAQRGVIQPVIVRPMGTGRYQLVAGERRWRAAQRARAVSYTHLTLPTKA